MKYNFEYKISVYVDIDTEGKDLREAFDSAEWKLNDLVRAKIDTLPGLSDCDVNLCTVDNEYDRIYDYGICSDDSVEEVLG